MPRTRNLFDPKSTDPYKLSRSRLELFINCPRCFYLDRRLGVDRVSGPPFTLNSTVDALLKKEFDIYRSKKEAHPLMKKYKINAIPYIHKDLNIWRENFQGVQYLDPETNLLITGAVDDVWEGSDKKLIVVDYKATSTEKEVTLDDEWKKGYKRQMEIYQWLLRKNEFAVSDTGYFVYANAKKDRKTFDTRLGFDVQIIPYVGDDSWVENTIHDVHKCLMRGAIPPASGECEWCEYRKDARKVEGEEGIFEEFVS